MKKAINLQELINSKEEEEKPIEFTHYLSNKNEWNKANIDPENLKQVVYLGKCPIDGDMFAAYANNGYIDIYKGHYNSGKY